MMDVIYRNLPRLKYIFLLCAAVMVAFFLYISNAFVQKLSEEERVKAEIWATAVRELASSELNTSVALASKVIVSNTTIPVVIADSRDKIIAYNNFDSTRIDTAGVYLRTFLKRLKEQGQVIEIPLDTDSQYLYYDDSSVLRALSLFPYVQLSVIMVFLAVVFYAFSSAKRAEQQRVWLGLTKETAHQLGTPISSLLALSELLKELKVDSSIQALMDKDVARLQTIANRFSKIGSKPELKQMEITALLSPSLEYMRQRSSKNVRLELINGVTTPLVVLVSPPLFDWVVENLTKNAIDAMNGEGTITVTVAQEQSKVVVDFHDTGRGIVARHQRAVFNPGFTTKPRGWGLGLTLVKRIIEEFFDGKIYVKQSGEGKGTTFRLLLPKQ